MPWPVLTIEPRATNESRQAVDAEFHIDIDGVEPPMRRRARVIEVVGDSRVPDPLFRIEFEPAARAPDYGQSEQTATAFMTRHGRHDVLVSRVGEPGWTLNPESDTHHVYVTFGDHTFDGHLTPLTLRSEDDPE